MEGLRTSSGHLPEMFAKALQRSETLVDTVVQMVLDAHFPESLHDDILAAVGLTSFTENMVAEEQAPYGLARKRDPKFRERVLRAYEHRCAVTGFRAALGGSYFCWRQRMSNGMLMKGQIQSRMVWLWSRLCTNFSMPVPGASLMTEGFWFRRISLEVMRLWRRFAAFMDVHLGRRSRVCLWCRLNTFGGIGRRSLGVFFAIRRCLFRSRGNIYNA